MAQLKEEVSDIHDSMVAHARKANWLKATIATARKGNRPLLLNANTGSATLTFATGGLHWLPTLGSAWFA